jgi:hypothetical protein
VPTGDDRPNEPRTALFLGPGPATDLEVMFEIEGGRDCALELTATFVVAHSSLDIETTLPPVAPR